MRSDLKGFVFGGSLGLAALAGFGGSQIAAPDPVIEEPKDEPKVGRYQIAVGGSDHDRYRAYVLDTATGDVWEQKGSGFAQLKLNAPPDPFAR